ncbi:SDR family NAD(P)-dependent oxidoreductase [Primorskyibacter flagellatus]|uniref:Gluconate 5-dehydrogenase/2-deoxy-D-gluconate 3-dehydrogenase n=1 Tax=Primorskyibacter flagellatus TaxID=1387277 RepID=A0A1W2DAZ2_9RHOB|nr:SDR family NAD(P)-dependent oxidoreductase [Primorskyibacter flagellatus]SMC94660.1 gluconate 5-dehydrogenase/2-deoxy-D-gluconate 3-dehydrogenase [Primorskyibacter flagellatus]
MAKKKLEFNGDTLRRMTDLSGQTAVVTGGSAGIGKATARLLAEAGANVVIVNRRAEAGRAVADALVAEGHSAVAMACDVGDEESIRRLFEDTAGRFGTVDILVNNAGIMPKTPFTEVTAEEWDTVQRVNLRGAFLCMREAARLMQDNPEGGRIVNVSSTSSMHPGVIGNAAYCASKGGVNMLTKSAAFDLAPDSINVNAVLPGGTETEGVEELRKGPTVFVGPNTEKQRYRFGRLAEPLEVAAAIFFLASPAANYITGQTLVVDGGFQVA